MKSVKIVRQNSLYLDYTNEEESFYILKGLDVKKGPRMDGIRQLDLKQNVNLSI